MKEPTYSVFVRFRRGQRLTLRRFMPLDAAIRFAAQVRSERFHDPDAVFIVDDASGEMVVERTAGTGVTETFPEAPPTSAIQSSRPEGEDDLEALLQHVDRWQIRHAQSTLRSGQRLASTVERSLAQLARQMEHLDRTKLFGSDLPKVAQEIALAAEQVSSVREGLHALAARLSGVLAEVPDESETGAPEQQPGPSKRKEARGKR